MFLDQCPPVYTRNFDHRNFNAFVMGIRVMMCTLNWTTGSVWVPEEAHSANQTREPQTTARAAGIDWYHERHAAAQEEAGEAVPEPASWAPLQPEPQAAQRVRLPRDRGWLPAPARRGGGARELCHTPTAEIKLRLVSFAAMHSFCNNMSHSHSWNKAVWSVLLLCTHFVICHTPTAEIVSFAAMHSFCITPPQLK